jgi:hypothetical protein
MTFWQKIGYTAPVYVTRENARGEIGAYELNVWLTVAAMFVIYLNIMIWGIIGIVYAYGVIF